MPAAKTKRSPRTTNERLQRDIPLKRTRSRKSEAPTYKGYVKPAKGKTTRKKRTTRYPAYELEYENRHANSDYGPPRRR